MDRNIPSALALSQSTISGLIGTSVASAVEKILYGRAIQNATETNLSAENAENFKGGELITQQRRFNYGLDEQAINDMYVNRVLEVSRERNGRLSDSELVKLAYEVQTTLHNIMGKDGKTAMVAENFAYNDSSKFENGERVQNGKFTVYTDAPVEYTVNNNGAISKKVCTCNAV